VKNLTPLKLVGFLLAGIGMIVANEVQKRETKQAADEAVEKALEERGIRPMNVTHINNQAAR
jgi:hypothetical protein